MAKAKKINYIYAVGKRRTASARVRLIKGKGENIINEIKASDYFPGKINETYLMLPFLLTKMQDKYYFTARIIGGGRKSQLDALVHGIARAFSKLDSEKFRTPVKKAGLLTRDARKRQRRMVGMGGKSRRKRQSPKR